MWMRHDKINVGLNDRFLNTNVELLRRTVGYAVHYLFAVKNKKNYNTRVIFVNIAIILHYDFIENTKL